MANFEQRILTKHDPCHVINNNYNADFGFRYILDYEFVNKNNNALKVHSVHTCVLCFAVSDNR